MQEHIRAQGRTPAGGHVPIMVEEVLAALDPQPGDAIADCTVGHGGHAERFLERIGPTGRLVGLDVDQAELERTARRLAAEIVTPGGKAADSSEAPANANDAAPASAESQPMSPPVRLYRSHFAGLGKVMRSESLDGFDVVFADLGVSSMQIDDPARGFSFKSDGPLDMRMDLRLKRTAADLLRDLPAEELASALVECADEPDAEAIARRIADGRIREPLQRTRQLSRLVLAVKGLTPRQWKQIAAENPGTLHPAARTFQALRILVNDEFNGLEQFLRAVPYASRSGGRIGILSFHSGEHARVERFFKEGLTAGLYASAQLEPLRPSSAERGSNPRSRSAQLRCAKRA
ncbi:MAG: 16S rRNA (cytosine(1402)-N(4))-methyltransferase RsmH [Phycisphaerae bacterium]|nr:16S rRNA (cytosine(1402)-N(4))-methyltransferase RsmH [Phycisphaerae bacterium]